MPLELNTAGLGEALQLKLEVTERALPDVLNKAGKDVSLRAVQFSAAVPSAQISEELRRVVAVHAYGKRGKRLKKTTDIHDPTTLSKAIIIARLRRKGINPRSLTTEEIRQMVLKMASARVRSGSYLKTGYLPAARTFGAGAVAAGVRQWGTDHGTAVLASVDHLLAQIINTVPEDWQPGVPAYERALAALQEAVNYVEKDILLYVDNKLAAVGFTR